MSVLLCDAVTASGRPCKNRSVGTTAAGRNYCYLKSHQRQVEAMSPQPELEVEEEPVEREGPSAIELEPEEVVEMFGEMIEQAAVVAAMTEQAEAALEKAASAPSAVEIKKANPCPSCGSGNVRYMRGKVTNEPGTKLRCRVCGHRWFL